MSKNPFGRYVDPEKYSSSYAEQYPVSDFKGEATDDDLNNEALDALENFRSKNFNKKMQ